MSIITTATQRLEFGAQSYRPGAVFRSPAGARVWLSNGFPGNALDIMNSGWCYPIRNWRLWFDALPRDVAGNLIDRKTT